MPIDTVQAVNTDDTVDTVFTVHTVHTVHFVHTLKKGRKIGIQQFKRSTQLRNQVRMRYTGICKECRNSYRLNAIQFL